MPKTKMSDMDKVKRFQYQFEQSFKNDDAFKKEILKIKDKGLKELLIIVYFTKIKRDYRPYDINGVMNILDCSERKAYDLVKTMIALDTMNVEFQNFLEKFQYEMLKKGITEGK